jgi:hypothetical protein
LSAQGQHLDDKRRAALERIFAIWRDAQPIKRPVIGESEPQPSHKTSRREAAGPIDAPRDPENPSPFDLNPSASPLPQNSAGESSDFAALCEDGMDAETSRSREPESNAPPQGDMFKARAFGFDVDKLNEEFALVLMGSKAVIFREQPEAPVDDQQRLLAIEAFKAWFSNRFTERPDPEGKLKKVTWAKAWLESRTRRQYSGIEFFPDRHNAPGTPGYLNLWSGFVIEPAENPDVSRYAIFRDHLFTNICAGNEKKFKYLFAFFADMVQRPRERPGVALVFRGRMGTGKTKVGEVFGSLIPRHYFLVDDPRYVTGNFNTHMASCLLLQADEAVWAGDKAAEGRLKGLITAPIQQIEAKGIDAVRLKNFIRLIMTSNEEWVVPAGKDERRFNIFDVADHVAQNHQYFREMDAELADGGLSHLLGDLLAFDLETVNLREILRTEALLEQKIRSLDSVESWWFGRLQSGAITCNGTPWPKEIVKRVLFEDYIDTSDKIGIRRKQEEAVFGIKLQRLAPGITARRATQISYEDGGGQVIKRPWCYVLPGIEEARASFEALVGQKVQWPSLESSEYGNHTDEIM